MNTHNINRGILCILLIFCFFFLGSCASKEDTIVELLQFRTELKEHCDEYSQSDWERAIKHYEKLCSRLDELDVTREEQLEINKIKGEIVGYAASVAAQDIYDEVKNISDEINSFTEGFVETFESPK